MTTRDRLAGALPLPPGRSTDWVLDALVPVVDEVKAAYRELDGAITAYMLGVIDGGAVAKVQQRHRALCRRDPEETA